MSSTACPAKEPVREISVKPESDQLNSQVGGRLKFFFKQWKKLTSDSFALECVQGYKIPFSRPVKQLSRAMSTRNLHRTIFTDASRMG